MGQEAMTGREAVMAFVRSRLVDTKLDDDEEWESAPQWAKAALRESEARLPESGIAGFHDRWSVEYADDLIKFLYSVGYVIVPRDEYLKMLPVELDMQRDEMALSGRLLDAYGRDGVTTLELYGLHELARLMVGLVKPDAINEWLARPAVAFGDKSILDCVKERDINTPLGALTSLWEGGVI